MNFLDWLHITVKLNEHRDFFNEIGIELLFLPVYSLDLNPVEEVFSKMKYLLKYRYEDSVFENLEYTVLRVVGDITAADLYDTTGIPDI